MVRILLKKSACKRSLLEGPFQQVLRCQFDVRHSLFKISAVAVFPLQLDLAGGIRPHDEGWAVSAESGRLSAPVEPARWWGNRQASCPPQQGLPPCSLHHIPTHKCARHSTQDAHSPPPPSRSSPASPSHLLGCLLSTCSGWMRLRRNHPHFPSLPSSPLGGTIRCPWTHSHLAAACARR